MSRDVANSLFLASVTGWIYGVLLKVHKLCKRAGLALIKKPTFYLKVTIYPTNNVR